MAAVDRISLRTDQAAATEVREIDQWIDDLRRVYETGVRIRAKMRHTFSDSGGANAIDWTQTETLWGIPAGGTSVGPTSNGSRVFTFVDATLIGMETNGSARDLTETVG